MFSLICAWINCWVSNREAGDFWRNRARYDVTVMIHVNPARSIIQPTQNKVLQNRVNILKIYWHYNDDIMGAMTSQITSLTIIYSTIYLGADQRKHQSSASLAFVWGIHRWQVNSPHKWPVTRKMFPFDDVIMLIKKPRVFNFDKSLVAFSLRRLYTIEMSIKCRI